MKVDCASCQEKVDDLLCLYREKVNVIVCKYLNDFRVSASVSVFKFLLYKDSPWFIVVEQEANPVR